MLENSGVYKFCKDDISKIENYEQAINDTENVWCCHHRLELTLDGDYAHSKEDLIRMGMYYNRPYFELIFMKDNEHTRLHRKAEIKAGKKLFGGKTRKGEKASEEVRTKLSISHIGKKQSKETIQKRIESRKNNPNARTVKGQTWSEFGKKFFEHYGIHSYENRKLYNYEGKWYRRHNKKCRWEK